MHAAIQLAPVLAAEKSKTAFYIAGGILVLWALIVSLGIGLRRPDFPTNLMGERTVIAISVVLVLATVTTAVATSGAPAKGSESTSTEAQAQPAPSVPSTPSGGATATSPAPATTGGAASTPAPSATASTKLALAANQSGQLSFNTKTLSARAGQVTIAFTNGSPLEHNVTISQGSTVLGATPTFLGGSRSLKLTLKAGTYTFYCSVPGHRQAGMEGTLKVS